MTISFKSITHKYSLILIIFILVISFLTLFGIRQWVQPNLRAQEESTLLLTVKGISTDIQLILAGVQAQQKATTQLVAHMDSEQIDNLLPYLVDQYGNQLIFGGGIWPLPNKRIQGVNRASTFYHRNDSGKLIANTYWNSDKAPDYYTQPWHIAGQKAAKGKCVWANAYKDGASTQPRTNCAMAIYQNNSLYGVSTVDVTLGFFNGLVAEKEREMDAEILIVEADGTILSTNRVLTEDSVILSNLTDQDYAMAKVLSNALANSEARREFVQNDEDYTLLIQKAEGTPWLIAVAQPTRLLTSNTKKTMDTLAMLQLPMVFLLLLVLLFALKNLGSRFKSLKSNVDTLSAGDADLRMRLPLKGEDELDEISMSMNKFIAYLQHLIEKVTKANQTCSEQIIAMAKVTEQVLATLDSHVKETDMVATAVNELSSSAQEVAGHTKHSSDITREAQKQAEEAGKSVEKAHYSVNRLMKNVEVTSDNVSNMQENAAAIESVLQVIGSIAEQTNLLALNAAIEAARAGEMGRGFAVVADEVRNLAAKTQDSTTEVAEMLGTLKDGVEITVASMSETKEQSLLTSELTKNVIDGIVTMKEAVAQVDDVSVQIATAANEQSDVAESINESMVSIRTMLQELHTQGRKSGEHAQALSATNQELQSLVSQFKL